MKAFILIALLLAVHTTNATIDIQKLKDSASEQLQALHGRAASTLQQLTDNIDLKKIQDYDFLHIIPILQNKQRIIQEYSGKLENIPTILQSQGDRIRLYFKKLQSLTGKNLVFAFDAVPWPVLRRMDD